VTEVDVAGRSGLACGGDGAAQAIMMNAATTISRPVAPVSHVLVARSALMTAVMTALRFPVTIPVPFIR
jgi:hypothetical protein